MLIIDEPTTHVPILTIGETFKLTDLQPPGLFTPGSVRSRASVNRNPDLSLLASLPVPSPRTPAPAPMPRARAPRALASAPPTPAPVPALVLTPAPAVPVPASAPISFPPDFLPPSCPAFLDLSSLLSALPSVTYTGPSRPHISVEFVRSRRPHPPLRPAGFSLDLSPPSPSPAVLVVATTPPPTSNAVPVVVQQPPVSSAEPPVNSLAWYDWKGKPEQYEEYARKTWNQRVSPLFSLKQNLHLDVS